MRISAGTPELARGPSGQSAFEQGRHGGLADLDEVPERADARRPGCSTKA